MLGYLSADIICSEKRTVFRERSSGKTVSFEEQIMSKDKYPSIFSQPNWGFCVYYPSVLNIGEYLVNKPLPVADISADNVRGWETVRKMNNWPRSEASRANVKFWGQSLSQGHYQPMYQQAVKGFIDFISLPLIFFAIKPRVNMVKKASGDLMANARVIDVRKQKQIWLV